jgi:hypothetical protein
VQWLRAQVNVLWSACYGSSPAGCYHGFRCDLFAARCCHLHMILTCSSVCNA